MSQVIDSLVAIPALIQLLLRGIFSPSRSRSRWLFLAELIKRPASVGAVWPSSRRLARSMAEQVPVEGEGLIVELGGGTGVVTEALLERGIDPSRMLIVERAPGFVQHLRQRFPAVQVVEGDAAALQELLPKQRPVEAIVSSLPLRSLPLEVGRAIVDQWQRVLVAGGAVIQFTYDLRGFGSSRPAGFVEKNCPVIWFNLPPARVMVLDRPQETPRKPAAIQNCPEVSLTEE